MKKATRVFTPEQAERKWHLIDAEGKVLGRVATCAAAILRGKQKPTYSPAFDMGDFVVVINAEKIRVTGNKLQDKIYYTHSGYFGHLKETPLRRLLEKRPTAVLEEAVWGMLPKNRIRRKMFNHLHVYVGADHPHQAQSPQPIEV
jgi:large subunit ribosomal protein L13